MTTRKNPTVTYSLGGAFGAPGNPMTVAVKSSAINIVIDCYAHVRLILDYSQKKGPTSVEINLLKGSRLDLFEIFDREDDQHVMRFILKKESALHYSPFISAGIKDIEVALIGAEAQAHINALAVSGYAQTINLTTTQQHRAPATQSYLRGVSVGFEESKFSHRGMIHIERSANQAHASQHAKSLLIADSACAFSVPAIEVLANDVQCAHGSAVGRLDNEQLSYIKSRGIDQKLAAGMLIDAACSDIIHTIDDEKFQKMMRESVHKGIHACIQQKADE